MAIFMAFQSPQLEVLGLTTIFGNVSTEDVTRNALLLIAGCPGLPVAKGIPEPLKDDVVKNLVTKLHSAKAKLDLVTQKKKKKKAYLKLYIISAIFIALKFQVNLETRVEFNTSVARGLIEEAKCRVTFLALSIDFRSRRNSSSKTS
ncbi:hypothetical protein CsSME_00031621 [Camellia sinensis var. sinensis]